MTTRIKRQCADCSRTWHVRPESRKLICPVCTETLRMEGAMTEEQPRNPTLYTPRYNGLLHYDRTGQ